MYLHISLLLDICNSTGTGIKHQFLDGQKDSQYLPISLAKNCKTNTRGVGLLAMMPPTQFEPQMSTATPHTVRAMHV